MFGNKKGEKRQDYRDKIRQYKAKNIYRVILALVVVAVVIIIVRVQYAGHVYTAYEVLTEAERTKSSDAVDKRLGETILTYSKDGAHSSDSKGDILWNQTYQIQDIKVETSSNVVGIGNYNGREVYVLDDTKQLYKVTTTMPIRNLTVAENGNSTIILYDTDATYINTYDSTGVQIFSGQTHMSNSGYPIAIALSPNGKLLSVAYMYVDAGAIKTTVAFYNFGTVGDNYKDYLVSGFDYNDVIVPEVGFLSNGTAYAIADNRIMFYTGQEQPEVKAEYMLDQEILSVYAENGYLGLVFTSDKSDYQYKLRIYDSNANQVGDFYFDIDYTDILFEKKDFVIYNESECIIKTYENRDKFRGKFDISVNVMIPTEKAYRYIIAGDSIVQTIQLN